MNTRSVGAVVGIIESRIPESWQVAPWPGELFAYDEAGQVSLYSHRALSVAADTTEWETFPGTTRRRNAGAAMVTTRIAVRYLVYVATDDGSSPYRGALDAEAELVARIQSPDAPAQAEPVRVIVRRATRQVHPEGMVTGTIEFDATHHIGV